MPELHPSDERLLDLALNDLDGRDQDALSAHLALCEACRLRYAAIADTVDGVLAAAPSVAPPPGFTTSALAAMGVDPAQPAPASSVPPAPGRWRPEPDPEAASKPAPSEGAHSQARRRTLILAVVAAVVALLAGALGTALVLQSSSPPPSVTLAGAPLVRVDGATVGSVQSARYEGDSVLVVSVQGPPGAAYDCRVQLADGTQRTLSSWTLPPDGGATWVLDSPAGRVTRMDLVAPSGRVWASAEL